LILQMIFWLSAGLVRPVDWEKLFVESKGKRENVRFMKYPG